MARFAREVMGWGFCCCRRVWEAAFELLRMFGLGWRVEGEGR